MRIDDRKCVGCGNCVAVCPMGAIAVDRVTRRAAVNEDECVECHTCYRGMSREHLPPALVRAVRRLASVFRFRFEPEPDVCPTGALTPQKLAWPRSLRRAFSDPLMPHESTGLGGRGTEEVKTNDVTGRVGLGEAGFTIEFGRPGIGVRFREIERVTRALAATGVEFEAMNPLTFLMEDTRTGALKPDILDEKILSAILEIKTTMGQVGEVLSTVGAAARGLDTVISIGVSARCDARGDTALDAVLHAEGFDFWRGKTNLGLGRPRHPGAA